MTREQNINVREFYDMCRTTGSIVYSGKCTEGFSLLNKLRNGEIEGMLMVKNGRIGERRWSLMQVLRFSEGSGLASTKCGVGQKWSFQRGCWTFGVSVEVKMSDDLDDLVETVLRAITGMDASNTGESGASEEGPRVEVERENWSVLDLDEFVRSEYKKIEEEEARKREIDEKEEREVKKVKIETREEKGEVNVGAGPSWQGYYEDISDAEIDSLELPTVDEQMFDYKNIDLYQQEMLGLKKYVPPRDIKNHQPAVDVMTKAKQTYEFGTPNPKHDKRLWPLMRKSVTNFRHTITSQRYLKSEEESLDLIVRLLIQELEATNARDRHGCWERRICVSRYIAKHEKIVFTRLGDIQEFAEDEGYE